MADRTATKDKNSEIKYIVVNNFKNDDLEIIKKLINQKFANFILHRQENT